ncbi:carbon-nitrogen hydrolase family protein [Streptomyces lasalocidi]
MEIGVRVYSTTAPAFGRDEAILVDPRGTVLGTYQKAHPIPGSEKYTPGDGHVPVVRTPYGRIANVICYDADFPALMQVRADIMLVPSHDWRQYGRAHTDKAAVSAVEGGHALIRQDAEGSRPPTTPRDTSSPPPTTSRPTGETGRRWSPTSRCAA